ncbi:MAG TPA: T9SS type A sorting domain-containing protein [Bacteroidota bacterium]|nr:T9SS type A sorting domain-containing protein [Bacteroidota bacterium]
MKFFTTIVLMLLVLSIGYAQTVEFRVNMSVQMKKETFNAAQDSVYVRGSFNSYGLTDLMSDGNGDSIYSVTLTPGSAGDTIQFKFFFRDVSASADMWEGDPNRTHILTSDTTIYEDYYNRDSVFVQQFDIAVAFSCNMELERLSGRFDPGTDTVSVNGTFNSWTAKHDILTPNPLNADLYEADVTIRVGVGEKINFKFWYTDNNWESVSDREYTFTQTDVDSLKASFSASFNNGTLETVINQPCIIKFTVDAESARSAISGNLFPVVNTVHIAGSAAPLQWPGGGWPGADSTKVLKLYDDGTNGDAIAGDKIYTRNVTFPAYTILGVEYKYGINYGDTTNNEGGNDNEAGVGDNHRLQMTRFMSGARAIDVIGVMDTTVLDNVTGITPEYSALPESYVLSQNYPNPFNPSTNIKFSLPNTGFVTLKVYNILGQDVATLINGLMETGTYNVDFDASDLSSGIYMYRLQVRPLNAGSSSASTITMTKKLAIIR